MLNFQRDLEAFEKLDTQVIGVSKDSIEKNNVRCLLYQSPKPDIVDTLTKKSQLAAFALDPLGLELEDENEAWFQIMLSTAATFKKCLAN